MNTAAEAHLMTDLLCARNQQGAQAAKFRLRKNGNRLNDKRVDALAAGLLCKIGQGEEITNALSGALGNEHEFRTSDWQHGLIHGYKVDLRNFQIQKILPERNPAHFIDLL